jgi:hypothetical protein
VGTANGPEKHEGKKILPGPLAGADSTVAAAILTGKFVTETKDDAYHGGTGDIGQVLRRA